MQQEPFAYTRSIATGASPPHTIHTTRKYEWPTTTSSLHASNLDETGVLDNNFQLTSAVATVPWLLSCSSFQVRRTEYASFVCCSELLSITPRARLTVRDDAFLPVCNSMVFFRAGVLMRRLLETVYATMSSMLRVQLASFPPSQLTWLRFANVTFHSPDVFEPE